jgi:hypothetical protein
VANQNAKPPVPSKEAQARRQQGQRHAISPQFPSFDEFERALTPDLGDINEVLRVTFLLRAYELARKKLALEKLRNDLIADVPTVRKAIKIRREILTQIRRAVRAIDAAQKKAKIEHPELLRDSTIMEARGLLKSAEAELTWMIHELLPSFIHPQLQEKGARPAISNWPLHARYSVGFGVAKINYWFIGEIDQLLDICLTMTLESVKVGRDKIIQKIFRIALNYCCEIEQIKTARLQKSRERLEITSR